MPDMDLHKILDYFDSISNKFAKVNTINSLTLFSNIVNSFPSDTPGLEEAAHRINDRFFPHQQDEEDGLAYVISHKDFVSLKQDFENLSQIFKHTDRTGPEELLCSEKRQDSIHSKDSVTKEDLLYELSGSEISGEDNLMVEMASSIASDEDKHDILNKIQSGDQRTQLTSTSKTDLLTSGHALDDKNTDFMNSGSINQSIAITQGVTRSNEATDQVLFDDNRQHLKELVAWIFEEVPKLNEIPTNFDPLRGQSPSYYGLSSYAGKLKFCC